VCGNGALITCESSGTELDRRSPTAAEIVPQGDVERGPTSAYRIAVSEQSSSWEAADMSTTGDSHAAIRSLPAGALDRQASRRRLPSARADEIICCTQ
jgi:hypothetical protein